MVGADSYEGMTFYVSFHQGNSNSIYDWSFIVTNPMQTVSPNSPLPKIFSPCIHTENSYHHFYVLFSMYTVLQTVS